MENRAARRRRQHLSPGSPDTRRASAPSSDSEIGMGEDALDDYRLSRAGSLVNPPNLWDFKNYAIMISLTVVGFLLRFYKLSHPDQVVFDEVHFGKFAAYYITRRYYFDVHPPLAKLLLGLAGWFVGFNGDFDFANIGDSYTEGRVPFVGMRALPAFLGSVTVPFVYAIMRESGYESAICAFSTLLVLLDNAHIAQTRLILLDAQLVFFMTLSLYSYVKFRKFRHREFSRPWYTWLTLTGVFLACTLGCKMVGLFTFLSIGTAVLVDLWDVLDVRREGHTMKHFVRHFTARAVSLIIIPAIVYLSFFWVHFAVLSKSGTGDSFMSPAFQETLSGNELLVGAMNIRYYDTITVKHRDTKLYLHSHPEKYPLRYDDGRISSQGQQVTAYGHEDVNNQWVVLPTKSLPPSGEGRIVQNQDVVQFLHAGTNTLLMTHDVASPLMPTNQEFTTASQEAGNGERRNDTLFRIDFENGKTGDHWKSKSGWFKLIHVSTRVGLWTYKSTLPEWAFGQQEVNGKKQIEEKGLTWFVNEIISDEFGRNGTALTTRDTADSEGVTEKKKKPKSLSFIRKFGELQLLMLQHNAGLTASHPYASSPLNWPFLLSGISFWTENDKKEQMYLIGNVVGWWSCVMAISVFVGIIVADLLARRRAIYPIPNSVRNRLWNNVGFFVISWAFHYFPFYLMNRQLFLHHYLPAHICSALVAGGILDFVLSEINNYPISYPGPSTKPRRPTKSDLPHHVAWGIVGIVTIGMIAMFLFIAPLTYGTPSLEGEAINKRQILSSWTLHFAAKVTNAAP